MHTVYTPEQAAQECINASFIRLVFSRPHQGESTSKVRIRSITLKGKPFYQIEAFRSKQVFQKNVAPDTLLKELPPYFSAFRTAECYGRTERLFFLQNNKGRITLTKRAALEATQAEAPHNHNREKHVYIEEGTPLPFLIAQGLMNADGVVLKSMYRKFRQVNKFLEFIAGVEPFIREYSTRSGKPFAITDFGCGKAYLSFALYYYLHECKGLPVRVHGLDIKTDVVSQCAALAAECSYDGLTFAEGDIADYPLPEGTGMMVCLHACNTATDLALAQAVRQSVPVIFAVPCCQHELYAQLKAHKGALREAQHVLLPFMEQGIITERFASLLTDTVRALLLQMCGYTVRIMEFIETEHTPKNILIHAVKPSLPPEQEQKMREQARQKYYTLKRSFFIEPCLEKLLRTQEKEGHATIF
ncbi:MAG: class I SAM-dependent methyltransferase [Treponema sp.]